MRRQSAGGRADGAEDEPGADERDGVARLEAVHAAKLSILSRRPLLPDE